MPSFDEYVPSFFPWTAEKYFNERDSHVVNKVQPDDDIDSPKHGAVRLPRGYKDLQVLQ